MPFRAAAILLIASLTALPLCSTAGDMELSPEFKKTAPDYLKALGECWDRLVRMDRPDPCTDEDVRKKAENAASTPGDKAVLHTLNSWDGTYALMLLGTTTGVRNEAQQSKWLSELKPYFEVCSAELKKALEVGAAPDKSECNELLEPKTKPK